MEDSRDGAFVHQNEIQRSFGGSHIHTAVVQTLVSMLYGLSNQSLGDTGREALASMMATPAWDTVLPHLKDVLAVIDSKIIQAIAEGLLKESIHACNHSMFELSLGLGADPTQRTVQCLDLDQRRHILSTPLVAICNQYGWRSRQEGGMHSLEKFILSLLRRDPHVSNSDLLWIISANCHAIAEDLIRSQPERVIDFSIARSDLGGETRTQLVGFYRVTPLMAACSNERQGAEKVSLIRCLLERNAKADLQAMVAAAGACDGEVISLLHQHGAPVTGFIPEIGSPLSRACKKAAFSSSRNTRINAVPLLLSLGASPNNPKGQDLNSGDFSPLHILALSEEEPGVTRALDLLLKHGADINHRSRSRMFGDLPGYSQSRPRMALTALESAIERARWISAMQLLSANCELTGRELLFMSSMHSYYRRRPGGIVRERFRQFIGALLAKAPEQATALHLDGLTVLQKAIEIEYDDLILALFAFGVSPMPSDFLLMLCNREKHTGRAEVRPLSSSVQMKLVLAARSSEPPITEISTVRLILAFACPEVVRHIFNGRSGVYDSEGLCHLIARLISSDKTIYYPNDDENEEEDRQPAECLTMDDLRALVSRRTISNRDENWERNAVVMAARAGRADILRILIEPSEEGVPSSGLIPSLHLSEVLTRSSNTVGPPGANIDDLNSSCLSFWIKYCRMERDSVKCSALTAAAMVVPEAAAEGIIDLLLSLNYEPDGWTVLVASCQGYLSILQRLKRLDCWSHILSHDDCLDWYPTALQAAVYNSHLSTVRFLLDTGTMFVAMDLPPSIPLLVPTLLEDAGGIYEGRTILPKTALQHAVDMENMEVVTLLVNAGANINAPPAMDSGATALQIASIKGSIPMMEYLMSQGADPYAAGATYDGRTALEGAAEHGRKDAVELLLALSESTAWQDREQLVKAVFYAEWNAQHVVAGILRERLLPLLSSEDEKILKMFSEKWKGSTGYSERFHLHEIEAWAKTFDDIPKSLRAYEGDTTSGVTCEENDTPKPLREYEGDTTSGVTYEESDTLKSLRAHEGDTTSGVTYEETDVENPTAVLENGFWGFQEWEIGIEDYGELDIHQIGGADLYEGDVTPGFTFQADDTALVDYQPSFEENGVDDTLFDDFSFDDLFR